jgi:lysozyme
MSEPEARVLLMVELEHTYAPGVMRLCPGLVANKFAFNAIVDFAYNLGLGRLQTSTLRQKINAQDWLGAQGQLLRWTRGGGRVLPGLVKRRQAEKELVLSDR